MRSGGAWDIKEKNKKLLATGTGVTGKQDQIKYEKWNNEGNMEVNRTVLMKFIKIVNLVWICV